MDAAQQMHSPVRERFIQMLRDRPSGVKQSQELLMTLGTTSEELMAIINPLLQEAIIEMMQDDKQHQHWIIMLSISWIMMLAVWGPISPPF